MTYSVFSNTSHRASAATASASRQRQPARGSTSASSPAKAKPCSTCVKEYGSKSCCEVSEPHASPSQRRKRPHEQSHRRPCHRSSKAAAASTATTASHGQTLRFNSSRAETFSKISGSGIADCGLKEDK